MRDLYNVHNSNFQIAQADNNAKVNQTINIIDSNFNYKKILDEVEKLKEHLHNEKPSDDRDILIGELAQLNKALVSKDDNKIIEIFKLCGKQLYGIAERIGCSLIATLISKQIWP